MTELEVPRFDLDRTVICAAGRDYSAMDLLQVLVNVLLGAGFWVLAAEGGDTAGPLGSIGFAVNAAHVIFSAAPSE